MKESQRKSKGRRNKKSVMDPKIWKELHKELMEEVIVRLPISTLFVSRTVCQEWNDLSRSPSFVRRWTELASQKRPLLHINIQTGSGKAEFERGLTYEPYTKKWHPSNIIPGYLTPDAAAFPGGLVYYNGKIGNPLTQTWKIFPRSRPTQLRGSITRGFVMLNEQVSKIVLVDEYGSYEVYRLSFGSSTPPTITRGNIPPNVEWPSILYAKAVSINSVVYFMGRKSEEGMMSIVSYDVVNGSWDQDLIPPPKDISYACLAAGGGRILLMGMVTPTDSSSINFCVWKIWRLSNNECRWIMVDSMPSSWCSEFSGKSVYLRYFSNTGLLGLSLLSERFCRIYTYDVLTGEWTKLPRCLPSVRGCQHPLTGVAFVPSLTATV